MARMPRFPLRTRTAALVMLVALFTAALPAINGGSGSAAPALVAEPRGAMSGADSVLDRPLGGIVTVTNTNDAGAGSLRQAIISANPGDTIVFNPGVAGTITLTSGVLNINKNLIIQGNGANVLAVSGANASKVFVVQGGVTATIAAPTVQNGTGLLGSGIENHGNLTLTAVAVINNGVSGTAGGGIYNSGNSQLTMQGVLVANNKGTNGGGLEMNNGVSMTNVTFFGNQGAFGAIFNAGFVGGPPTPASMLNVTITQNMATSGTAAGGITWGATDPLTVRNTIVANNQPKNCVGTFTSQGNNLEDTNTCGFNQPGDLANTPAGLDPTGLQNNGGQTQTVLILPSSAAFDGVTQGACPPPAIDQRGVTRPFNVRCDIGAVELQVTFTPTPTSTPTRTPTATPTATPTCILADMNCDGIVD